MCGNRDHTKIIHHVRLKRNKTGVGILKKERIELWSDLEIKPKLKSDTNPIMSDKKPDMVKVELKVIFVFYLKSL